MIQQLRPPSTLLIGGSGSGKTSSIVTLLKSGIAVRMLATESSAPNRVLEEARKRSIDSSRFDWQFVSPTPPSWDSLLEKARIVNQLALKDISELKGGIAKSQGKQFIAFIEALNDFKSDRTGASLGDISTWDADTAFVIDGLSGLSEMSRNLTVGWKPNPSPGEWGVMQSNILDVIRKLCSDLRCYFVCIGHIEREQNEITGMTNITVSTLGAKLAPKLPPLFTNVILSKRLAALYQWSVANSGVDTKPGDLDFRADLPQDFSPIVDAYRNRLKAVAQPAVAAVA